MIINGHDVAQLPLAHTSVRVAQQGSVNTGCGSRPRTCGDTRGGDALVQMRTTQSNKHIQCADSHRVDRVDVSISHGSLNPRNVGKCERAALRIRRVDHSIQCMCQTRAEHHEQVMVVTPRQLRNSAGPVLSLLIQKNAADRLVRHGQSSFS